MNRKNIPRFFFLLLCVAGLLTKCSPIQKNQQLYFGLQAAQRELWDEAIFRWKKVILINPDSVAAHNNLAVAYEKKGMFKEAKEEYEKALKLNPNNKYVKANYKKFQRNLENKSGDQNENKDSS